MSFIVPEGEAGDTLYIVVNAGTTADWVTWRAGSQRVFVYTFR